MKKLKFNIRTDEDGLAEKTGYEFDYPEPYIDYNFALYRASNCINSDKRWIVVELSTGLSIGGNSWRRGRTRKDAIEEARVILDKVGFSGFKERVAEVINQHSAIISGLANEPALVSR